MTSFTLDPAKTALVVIDMTKGVLSLSSGPYPVQQVLAKTVRLAEAFRRTGSFVAWSMSIPLMEKICCIPSPIPRSGSRLKDPRIGQILR